MNLQNDTRKNLRLMDKLNPSYSGRTPIRLCFSLQFQLPPYNDLPRWNNRIISNLLYYQTNYFALFAVLFVLQSFFNSQIRNFALQDFALGLSAVVVVAAVIGFAISDNPTFYQTRRDHPLITLGAIILSCYYFIQVLPSVLTVLFR
ncbi:hypothetical protein GCK32_013359 [Trichostrongylus colubriformis]|uniref:PRA1 family protein n=1 Tax=Trichostrongylus colubriformis TaxID=6319 RepID=A0AAN8IFR5_TRICO